MFPVYYPNRLVFDRPIRLLSLRGIHRYPACGGDVLPADSGYAPGRTLFPVREFSRWKPRGTDDIVVQKPRSVVKYNNSGWSLQILASQ